MACGVQTRKSLQFFRGGWIAWFLKVTGIPELLSEPQLAGRRFHEFSARLHNPTFVPKRAADAALLLAAGFEIRVRELFVGA